MTGLSRNTVAKWLHGEVDGPPKYRRSEQSSKLTAFHDALKLALKVDARRPKHERRTAKALYAEIRRAGNRKVVHQAIEVRRQPRVLRRHRHIGHSVEQGRCSAVGHAERNIGYPGAPLQVSVDQRIGRQQAFAGAGHVDRQPRGAAGRR